MLLVTYEVLRRWMRRDAGRQLLPSWQDALCGASAGAAAMLATHPMDVLKTRLMVSSASSSAAGMLTAAMRIWQSEGAAAFTTGLVPRLLHKIPSSGVFWLLYETFRRALGVSDVDC